MIVATAGHVDHGKTSLVRALTGIDTDRLPEEKRRNLTIDLGFAYMPLADGGVLGFVDVPGHERFIRNMLCGVAAIDYALLAVAADDGVMPQTQEHLAILELLGVAKAAVAITKTDRVDPDRVAEVAEEVELYLDGTRLAGAPFFPVSSVDGSGVEALKAHLDAVAGTIRRRAADGHFRLAVDRAFTVVGAGLVVTGNGVFGQRVGRRPASAVARTDPAARARDPRPGPQVGNRAGGRAAGAQHRRPVARQGQCRARRLGGGGRGAPAGPSDRRDGPHPGGRVPLRGALDPGARPSRGRRRHGDGSLCSKPGRSRRASPGSPSSCSTGRSARCTATASSCATSRRRGRSAAERWSTSCRRRAVAPAPRGSPIWKAVKQPDAAAALRAAIDAAENAVDLAKFARARNLTDAAQRRNLRCRRTWSGSQEGERDIALSKPRWAALEDRP